jgi:hypothetical protein
VFTKEREKEVYKKIEPELRKADLKELDKVPSYKLIDSLLISNASSALELAKTIHDRAIFDKNCKNNEDLLKPLRASEWKRISLNETAINVQFEIQKALLKQDLEQQRLEKLGQLQQQNKSLYQDYKRFQSVAFSICGLFIVLFILLFLMIDRTNKKFLKKYIIQTTTEAKPDTWTEKDVQNITNEIWNRLERRKITQPVSLPIIDNSNRVLSPKPRYLKGRNGKTFSRVVDSPENSFFKLSDGYEDLVGVEFEFSGNEQEAIAKQVFHGDICIISGSYQNAHSVKMEKPGKVKRVGEHWEVIERISIKLI